MMRQVPAQSVMEATSSKPDKPSGDVLLAGAASASRVATAGYALICAGHLWLLRVHSRQESSAEPWFFGALAVVEVALAVEALIFAAGAFGRPGSCKMVLRAAGRVRLLGAAIAWPWLLPWVAELGCRGHVVSAHIGVMLVHQTTLLALAISGFFLLRELSLLLRREPLAALEAAAPAHMGDCLAPGQAVFGGHFRLDKADLEETGRAVFVPARPRQGLFVGAGLALLGHLLLAPFFASSGPLPPWQTLGALSAVAGRWFGQLPKFKGRDKEREPEERFDSTLLWRREGPRLICRIGELLWIGFCLLELQRREASVDWSPTCALA